jgi:dTDP-4-amino-4,6-dideoxygalactose transaminase
MGKHNNIPVFNPRIQFLNLKNELSRAVLKVLKSGLYSLGKETELFEKEFARYTGCKYAISTNSGTDALFFSLITAGVGPGDEVITVSNTFIATAEAISHTGAKPVFVDVDAGTMNMDPQKISSKITNKTKVILPVHLYGNPADMDAIKKIAREFNIKIVEDCCQAAGAEYKNKKVGSLGDFGCFSFYPTKNLNGCGDAGIITTDNRNFYKKICLLKNHGRTSTNKHGLIGYNSRMDELQAAILNIKLKHLDKWNTTIRSIADKYNREIDHNKFILPTKTPKSRRVYYTYVIRTNKRKQLIRHLDNNNISTGIYYPVPIHLQKAYLFLNLNRGELPIAEKTADKILSLPIFPELKHKEISRIIDSINKFN